MVDEVLAKLDELDELIRKLRRRKKHPIAFFDPAGPRDLEELEAKLGTQIPVPVRRILESFDGTTLPLSPMRPDCLMHSWRIDPSDGVVPLIDCELDPETGLSRGYGVAIANPWGLLKERSEDGWIDADFTLLEWFAMIAKELATYEWPTPRTIVPLAEWSPRARLDEAELRGAAIGTAVASRVISTKRNRIALELFVLVDPERWVSSRCRAESDNDPRPLQEMCSRAAEDITYVISRHPSQWAVTATEVARVRRNREMFLGAARIV